MRAARSTRTLAAALGALLLLTTAAAHAQGAGKFLDPFNVVPEAEQKLRLLNDYRFQDPQGQTWMVKKGWVVDNVSIPKPLWTAIVSPFADKVRNASVVHDYYCETKERGWRETHRVFYDAMLAAGVEPNVAKTMYYAVLAHGPRWDRVVIRDVVAREQSGQSRLCFDLLGSRVCSSIPIGQNAELQRDIPIIVSRTAAQPSSLDDVTALKARLDKGEDMSAEAIETLALGAK